MSGADQKKLRKLPKIDAHHHLFDFTKNSYPWLNEYPKSTKPHIMYELGPVAKQNFPLDVYRKLSKPENVVKSVFIQAGMADPFAETRWVQSVSDKSGYPIMIVPFADLRDPNLAKTVETHLESPNVRGIRHRLADSGDPDGHVPDMCDDYVWQAGFQLLKNYPVAFDLHVFPRQMEKMINQVQRNPDIPIGLCHTGEPYDQSPSARELWKKGMTGLAELPNVHVKISGFGMFMTHWTEETAGPFVHETIDLFGPDRCMFASNAPIDFASGPYKRTYAAFYQWASGYSEDEQHALFYGTAEKFYRFPKE
jgi:predicted TIM-barrel fold metal-dependent hydrolase